MPAPLTEDQITEVRERIVAVAERQAVERGLERVSMHSIAQALGWSATALYRYFENKDAILADLSLVFMQQDSELFGKIFEGSSGGRQKKRALVDDLVEALMTIHRDHAQVRGVVYQNLERLKLLGPAQSATRTIQAKGTTSVPELDPILTWVAISAINAAVHSMSQLPQEFQEWDFARVLVRSILDNLLSPHRSRDA